LRGEAGRAGEAGPVMRGAREIIVAVALTLHPQHKLKGH